MGDLEVLGRDTLRASVETLRQRNGCGEAPFNLRVITHRGLISREIDGLGENSLTLCCGDKPHVVLR